MRDVHSHACIRIDCSPLDTLQTWNPLIFPLIQNKGQLNLGVAPSQITMLMDFDSVYYSKIDYK